MESTEKEILVIGGGIAGMSAGIYARQNGYRATIVEMGENSGGQLTAWQRQGYTFDYCLQWLVGSDHGVYHDIFREIGAIQSDTQVMHHDVFYKMVDKNYGDFFFYGDMDRGETYLKELAPEDSKGIHKLCNMIKKVSKMEEFANPPGMRSFVDYLGQLFKCWSVFPIVSREESKGIHKLCSMIKIFFLMEDFANPPGMRSFVVYVGQIFKCWSFFPIVSRYRKYTSRELLDELGLKNKRLRHFLNYFVWEPGHDFPGALGFLMILGFQHNKNGGYLKGGSAQMNQRIADTYKGLGGTFKSNSRVREILVEENVAKGVVLENGQRLLADHIISACDGHTVLYDMLGGKYLPSAFKTAYEEWMTFTPLMMVSFGINKTIVSEAHDTGYYGKGKIQIGRTSAVAYNIMNRSMYDDTLAPEGKTCLQLYFQSPWDIWQKLSDDEYAQEKEAVTKRCTELLEAHYPGVTEHLEVVDLATPRTTAKDTGVWKGAYEGFEPSLDMLGKSLPMELEGLENFLMVGQWVMPGGGLPPSAQSGRWAIQKLAKKDKKSFKHYVPK